MNTLSTDSTSIQSSILAFLMLLVAIVIPGQTVASPPCTDAERRTSQAHYDNNGKLLATAPHGTVAPKFCPSGTPTDYRQTCGKSGASPAIDFLARNIEAITTAALLSKQVYVEAARFEELHEGRINAPPASEPYDVMTVVPSSTMLESRKGVTVPPRDSTTSWRHRESGLHFTLTRRASFIPNGERDVVLIAFRGTDMFNSGDWSVNAQQAESASYLVALLGGNAVPYMYQQAQEVAFQLAQQRIKQGCPFSIVYTGHSLGGGLAVHAAFMAGSSPISCKGKKDSLVTFNSSLASRDNLEEYKRLQNDVGLYAMLYATRDPLRNNGNFHLLPFERVGYAHQASQLAHRAQVVMFPNVQIAEGAGVCYAPCWHSIENLHRTLADFRRSVGQSVRRVPTKQVQDACRWYEPINR
jgi:hypothetical protein